ncbi:MAG: hypothetical protein HQM16_13315 [Deltaproteobacteria bacterium]|nr:hypothetical protein [Deltaproteobacteria bacterium]
MLKETDGAMPLTVRHLPTCPAAPDPVAVQGASPVLDNTHLAAHSFGPPAQNTGDAVNTGRQAASLLSNLRDADHAKSIARQLLANPTRPEQSWDSKDGSTLFSFGSHDAILFASAKAASTTACVSVQRGCLLRQAAQACRFCSTGRHVAFEGSLDGSEIAHQAIVAMEHRNKPSGEAAFSQKKMILYSGMGDSGLNPVGVVDSMRIIQQAYSDDELLFFMTTMGTPPTLLSRLQRHVVNAYEDGGLFNGTAVFLQVSLHGATDSKRAFVIPMARKHPIDGVLTSALAFRDGLLPYVGPQARSTKYREMPMVTLNYLMLGAMGAVFDGNAHNEDLMALIKLMHRFGPSNFIINLCSYNPDARDRGVAFGPVSEYTFAHWQQTLEHEGIAVKRFKSRGTDIRGGCGQLVGRSV